MLFILILRGSYTVPRAPENILLFATFNFYKQKSKIKNTETHSVQALRHH